MTTLIPSFLQQVNKLDCLSVGKLKLIKRSLERYFVSNRVNIFLLKALKEKIFLNFRNKLEKTFELQIINIATLDKISAISQGFSKSDTDILIAINAVWLGLSDLLDQQDDLAPFYYWAGEKGGQASLDKMVPDHNFQLENIKLKTQLDQRASYLVKTVDKTNQKIIARTITEGLKQRLSNQVIIQYLKQNSGRISKERADLISETELAYSMGLVDVETMHRNGIEMHKWITEADELTCEACTANESAGYVDVGDEFPSGVTATPAHVRCRCFLIPKLPLVINGEIWTGK